MKNTIILILLLAFASHSRSYLAPKMQPATMDSFVTELSLFASKPLNWCKIDVDSVKDISDYEGDVRVKVQLKLDCTSEDISSSFKKFIDKYQWLLNDYGTSVDSAVESNYPGVILFWHNTKTGKGTRTFTSEANGAYLAYRKHFLEFNNSVTELQRSKTAFFKIKVGDYTVEVPLLYNICRDGFIVDTYDDVYHMTYESVNNFTFMIPKNNFDENNMSITFEQIFDFGSYDKFIK